MSLRGIEATLQLAQSPNTKIVIIGSGKDGLPVILGMWTPRSRPQKSERRPPLRRLTTARRPSKKPAGSARRCSKKLRPAIARAYGTATPTGIPSVPVGTSRRRAAKRGSASCPPPALPAAVSAHLKQELGVDGWDPMSRTLLRKHCEAATALSDCRRNSRCRAG